MQCTTEATNRISISVASPPDPIVTGMPVKKGGKVSEGKPVLEVASRPVIPIQGVLPAFRDLRPGLIGPDVKQFQRALIRLGLLATDKASGVFDKTTSSAVANFYKHAGYQLPSQPESVQGQDVTAADAQHTVTVPRQELLVVRHLSAELGVLKTKLGSKLHTGDVVVESGQLRLRCLLDTDENVKLKTGAAALIVSSTGAQFRGNIDGIQEPPEGDAQKPADQPSERPDQSASSNSPIVYLHTRSRLKRSSTYQADVMVKEAAHLSAVVPASALWERPGGRTVVIVRQDEREHDVVVQTGMEIDGEVEIVGGGLRQGDQVVVSDRNTGAGSP